MSSAKAQPINREAVKTLAIAVGLQEAAKQLGLSYDRVKQWSCRENWFKPQPVQQLPATKHPVTSVTQPSEALTNVLAEDSNATRIGFSRAARKVAESLATDAVAELRKPVQAISASKWHQIAAGTHNWNQEKGAVSPGRRKSMLNLPLW